MCVLFGRVRLWPVFGGVFVADTHQKDTSVALEDAHICLCGIEMEASHTARGARGHFVWVASLSPDRRAVLRCFGCAPQVPCDVRTA